MNNSTIAIIAIIVLIAAGIWVYSGDDAAAPEEAALSSGAANSLPEPSMPAAPPESGVMEDGVIVEGGIIADVAVPSMKEFTVTGENFSFSPAAITVKKGDRVRITFKNSGGTHDWKLDEFGAATRRLQSGQEETIEFVADQAGSFEYYCSVGFHRAAGMKGTIMVQ